MARKPDRIKARTTLDPARLRQQHADEQALPADEGDNDPLYRLALDVEGDERLGAEMAE